ncbi:hypothetical protein ABZ477_07105 [Microbacterium sp. NPDC019599]|uniref:hypothetical protein n=1 Tax=Microbacterium sp. NPDC019599 TaxID=3154690 RepID=UPI00340355F0
MIVLLACCFVLLVSVPIAGLLLPLTRAQSTADAGAKASDHLDTVVATLPAELVMSDEENSPTEGPCRSDSEGRLVGVRRVVVVDPAFDMAEWSEQLRDDFQDWRFTRRALDLEGALLLSLVASDFSLVSVRSAGTEDGTVLTMTSWSPCLSASG